VALEAATLQQVAGGRLVLGVGMGVPRDYSRFGEPEGWRERAERLEEGIALVSRLLAGEEVTTDLRDFRARAVADGASLDADLVLWTPEGPEGVDLDAYRDAGVTWWLQGEEQVRPDELRRRLEPGPPALSGC
jgi:alkanesulfonate monooxygenase SsuD/methylene tetrahydromethanopterin reductase-like flavin-dependent oxidoreductase (luciferase family)